LKKGIEKIDVDKPMPTARITPIKNAQAPIEFSLDVIAINILKPMNI